MRDQLVLIAALDDAWARRREISPGSLADQPP
jgi:hypothetical protein